MSGVRREKETVGADVLIVGGAQIIAGAQIATQEVGRPKGCWRCKSPIGLYWQKCNRCGADFKMDATMKREALQQTNDK